jgi:hypothetical protein
MASCIEALLGQDEGMGVEAVGEGSLERLYFNEKYMF